MVVHVSPDGGQWGDLAGDARSAKLADGARRRTHEGGHCDEALLLLTGRSFRLSINEDTLYFVLCCWKIGREKRLKATKTDERRKANLLDRRETLYSYPIPRKPHSPKLYHLLWFVCLLSRRDPSRSRQAQAPHGFAQRVNPTLRPWVCDVFRHVSGDYGLEKKANGDAWKGLRRPMEAYRLQRLARFHWKPGGEEGQNSVEQIPYVPKR